MHPFPSVKLFLTLSLYIGRRGEEIKSRVASGMMIMLLIGMLMLTFNIRGIEATEPPETEWTRTFGGADDEEAFSVVEASDGGYAVAGYTQSFGAEGTDFWLVKVDSFGNLLWNRTYGGIGNEVASSIVQTNDGGYVIAGHIDHEKGWLVKTDSYGNMQWNETYSELRYCMSVTQTSDGGYAIAGWPDTETNPYKKDFCLLKTNSVGNQLWSRTYGRPDYTERPYFAIQTADSGYAITGYSHVSTSLNYDILLIKTDSEGVQEWNQTYGGASIDWAECVVETSDGGYAVAGVWAESDFWLVKADSSGNMLWNRTYGGMDYDKAYSVVQTVDGGYALAGPTHSFGAGEYDFWLVKVNSFGNHQWNKTYGGPNYEWAYSMVQTSDGGYIVAGITTSYAVGGSDFWLIKLAGSTPVGGVSIPVNKLGLLAPYIGLTILLAVTVVAVVYVKKRKKHKENHS